MKPKQIFISILTVLFVFPLMGTFAQQAANSGSIEVITTFDYPGPGNSTLPQKINERGDNDATKRKRHFFENYCPK
jgi:hypothetical protein